MEFIVAIGVYATVGYINKFTTENEVDHEIGQPPLYDRGHNLFPVISQNYPNGLLGAFLIYFIFRWGLQYPNAMITYLWMVSLLFIGRVFVFSVTQLPPPFPGCKNDSHLHFVFKKSFMDCLDLMYSGHTIHIALIMMFVLCLSPYWLERCIVVILTLLELCFIISSRMHYTSDVFVALLVSVLLFLGWPNIKKIYPLKKYIA